MCILLLLSRPKNKTKQTYKKQQQNHAFVVPRANRRNQPDLVSNIKKREKKHYLNITV